MDSKKKKLKEQAPFRPEGLGELSRTTMRFVRRHPDAARRAVETALNLAAIGYEDPDQNYESSQSIEDIAPIPADGTEGTILIGAAEAAERLQVSRATIYDWVKKRTMVGWRSDDGRLVIPEEQILETGKLVLGLEQLLMIIGDPRRTWAFITEERQIAHEFIRPIEKMRRHELGAVVAVALSCRANSKKRQQRTAARRMSSAKAQSGRSSRIQKVEMAATKARSQGAGGGRARRA